MITNYLKKTLNFFSGIGPRKYFLLQAELQLNTVYDFLNLFPFRYINKSSVLKINQILPSMDYVYFKGKIDTIDELGLGPKKRLVITVLDDSGRLKLVWFKYNEKFKQRFYPNQMYYIFGKLNFFDNQISIVHAELEEITPNYTPKFSLVPIYPSTERLKNSGLDNRQMANLSWQIFQLIKPEDLPENLSPEIIQKYRFINRFEAFKQIHIPQNQIQIDQAKRRFIFEDFFWEQLKLKKLRLGRQKINQGFTFNKVGKLFNHFYHETLPFHLTDAQKVVMKEIWQDCKSAKPMNRLLQGDVGSGKTIVAFLASLLAIDNSFQVCLIAPTEILARQHYATLVEYSQKLPITIELLISNLKKKTKNQVLEKLFQGEINIVIGTHALLEDKVKFSKLGLVIIDEQHKFGVNQRNKLYDKTRLIPHVLLMSATPIPRSLAMTLYGDMETSIIDQLPPGRKSISTVHKYDKDRHKIYDFIKEKLKEGRQCFIVYPIIEESEKLDYQDLYAGYEYIKSFFPPHLYNIAMAHGRQTESERNYNMNNFINNKAQLLVATTVIEVGVNIPNATIMLIESSQRFGLAQLHQLRGRVGRGSEQSYCLLLTPFEISTVSKERLTIMEQTNDGFKIAEKDLELRGPGSISGTQQSGLLKYKIADLSQNKAVLFEAQKLANQLLNDDENLVKHNNQPIAEFLKINFNEPFNFIKS